MTTAIKNKNIKYLSARERSRFYALLKIDSKRRTDSDTEELVELEMKAERASERENAVSSKRHWDE
ncbi:hypothetical protein [Stenotrophomonas phage StenR_269]|nr:hypothetical protein [Stenotrophomonas phage StenR_269]